MSEPTRYHAKDGWFFQRTKDGGVRILAPDSMGPGASQVLDLDAVTWGSVVAFASEFGENGASVHAALMLHFGHWPGGTVVPSATPQPEEDEG